MKTLGVQGKICVPECAAQAKMDAIRKYGGKLEIYGEIYGVKTEARAKQIAQDGETGRAMYISPYNDMQIAHGQSTIGYYYVK